MKTAAFSFDPKPYLEVAALWVAGSSAISVAVSDRPGEALLACVLYSALGIIDLVFLVKTVAATLDLMSDQGSEKRTEYAIQVAAYGCLKILCLGVIGFALWKWSNASGIGTILGVSTLIGVPLGGALRAIVMENRLLARQ
jgi:hypothetical protein